MARAYQALTGKTVTAVKIQLWTQAAPATTAASALARDTTLGTTGIFDMAASATLLGYVEEVEFDQEYDSDEVVMLGSLNVSEVLGAKRVTVTMTEILKYASGAGNFLQTVFNNSLAHADGDDPGARIASVTITRAGVTFEAILQIKSYRERYTHGKCLGTMVFTAYDALETNSGAAAGRKSQNPLIS